MVARTGAPQSVLDEVFHVGEEGVRRAFEEGLDRLSKLVLEAVGAEELWLDRIRTGLLALLGFLEDEPQWAGLLVLERPFEGDAALECTRRVHRALAEVLSEGRGEVIVGAELWPSTELIAELVVLGVLSVIRARMLEGERRPLVELASSLMSFVVVPYLGRGAAKADLAGNAVLASAPPSRAQVVPIRPHPRTMHALRVIASAPRLSNREIATAVGIKAEAGHVSKLLKPLEQRGLVENAGFRGAPGEANAWLLTPYGRRVLEVVDDSFGVARRREVAEGLRRAA